MGIDLFRSFSTLLGSRAVFVTVLSMELESIGSGTKDDVDGGREANVGIQSRNMDQRESCSLAVST